MRDSRCRQSFFAEIFALFDTRALEFEFPFQLVFGCNQKPSELQTH